MVIKKLILLFVLLFSINTAFALDFTGYAKDTDGNGLDNVSVSIEVYNFSGEGMGLSDTITEFSNASGFFNLSINGSNLNEDLNYKPVLIQYNSTTGYAIYMGQSLPSFPYGEIEDLSASTTTFYLKRAVTIDLSATGNNYYSGTYTPGDNSSFKADYKTGLTYNDGADQYSYINDSDCLITLNSNLSVNSSLCNLNITNIRDFSVSHGSYSGYFFINTTNGAYCNTTGDFSCTISSLASYDFSYVGGIHNINDSVMYIAAKNDSGDNYFYTVNATFGLVYSTSTPDCPAGKMASFGSGGGSMIGNNSGQFQFVNVLFDEGDIGCELELNISDTVDGLTHDSSTDYFIYASSETNNLTELSPYTNEYTITYQAKDTRLGYTVKESWSTGAAASATFALPADRNYSIMLYPNSGPAFPVKIELNNITEGANITGCNNLIDSDLYLNCSDVNVTTELVKLLGYARLNTSAEEQDYEDLDIVGYLIEPGNMIWMGGALPQNMGQWDSSGNDTFNATTGEYNITLPAAVLGSDILLFAIASKNVSNEILYYGSFVDTTLTYGEEPDQLNMTLYALLGELGNVSVGWEDNAVNITSFMKTINLLDPENETIESAHLEVEVDYSDLSGSNSSFSFMADVSQDDSGAFSIPLLNHSLENLIVYSSQYAPLKTSISLADLQEEVNISLSEFDPRGVDGEEITDLEMMMYLHPNDDSCAIPNPGAECYPIAEGMDAEEFNPFSLVIGGGQLDFEIKKTTNNITVRFMNVDLLASGPPDAMFDENADSSTSGSTMEEVWRFGSLGPEIYEYVLISVPYDASGLDEADDIYIDIPKFYYEDDWTTPSWEQGTNEVSELVGSDYEDYSEGDYAYYINGSKALCDPDDVNLTLGLCYKDTTNDKLWFKIPHFSGISPSVTGSSTSSGESSSSGGSNSQSTTLIADSAKLSEGYAKVVDVNWKMQFKVKEQNHNLKVNKINAQNVEITVSSDPQTKTLVAGDEWKVELTGDNYYDLFVKLNSIDSVNGKYKANLTIKSINELISAEVIGTPNDEAESNLESTSGQEDNESSEASETNLNWLWILIGIVIILVVVFVGYKLTRKTKTKK